MVSRPFYIAAPLGRAGKRNSVLLSPGAIHFINAAQDGGWQ